MNTSLIDQTPTTVPMLHSLYSPFLAFSFANVIFNFTEDDRRPEHSKWHSTKLGFLHREY